ncbi:MAG TPA: type II toxin-antitoxin system PemK/MazF family toxin [Tepidisphaeraceae bacterium]|nr:type II toxin-antitoxin system PemK/MazF family toxin [Tepidisphaeraceae bacterium]
MTYRTYHPKRGDVVHLNFSPSAGHEMADRHYALVLSPASYNRKSGMAIVCAVTSRVRGGPFEVMLTTGLLPDKRGVGAVASVVVADSVRQVDYRERQAAFIVEAPREVVEEVLDKLLAVLEEE